MSMLSEKIIIRGARQHNLRNVSLSIPRNCLVVITGLTVVIGLFNSRDVVRQPPLEVLRKEVG